MHSSRSHLDSMLDTTRTNLDILSTLSSSFQTVEAQASAFHSRCEALLAEQKRLTNLADNVGRHLDYYNYLDPITRRMNAPGIGSFVRGEEFSRMLSQLDECLDYMQAHVSTCARQLSHKLTNRQAKTPRIFDIRRQVSFASHSWVDHDSSPFHRHLARDSR